MDKELQKGTTTAGIVCKDGIVLVADKRASAGYLIIDKRAEKIQKISDHMAITTAGLVSDAQLFTKIIRAQLALLSIRRGKEPTVAETANLLASLTYANIRRPSMIMGIVGFLLGGHDAIGAHLYKIDLDGSVIHFLDYASDGSGSIIALGVLETLYREGCTIDEGLSIGIKALSTAIKRDLATGDGIDVMIISKDGVKKLEKEEINKIMKLG